MVHLESQKHLVFLGRHGAQTRNNLNKKRFGVPWARLLRIGVYHKHSTNRGKSSHECFFGNCAL